MAKTEFRATLSICFEIQLRILYNLHMTYDKIYRRKPHVGTGCGGIQSKHRYAHWPAKTEQGQPAT